MVVSYARYELQDCFVMNWLSAGPQAIPLESTETAFEQIISQYGQEKHGIPSLPVERGPLHKGTFQIDSYTGIWNYYRCREDHLVDLSQTMGTNHFLRSWAYTQLVSSEKQQAVFFIYSYGPVDVWVNNKLVFHTEQQSESLIENTFSTGFVKGANKVLVRFAGIASPNCRLAFALKVTEGSVAVRIPSFIPSLDRREELENANELVYLEKDVFTSDDVVRINWPPDFSEKPLYQDVRFQTTSGRIYSQAEDVGEAGKKLFLSSVASLVEGPYEAVLMPRAWEFYESNIRVSKTLDTWVMGNVKYSSMPYGSTEERRREALFNASRRENDLFAEIAKIALGSWSDVNRDVVEKTIQSVANHETRSEILLIGLLGMVARFGNQPEFDDDLLLKIVNCALSFNIGTTVSDSSDEMVLGQTVEILSGQLYPDKTFQATGTTGKQIREGAENRALSWMKARGLNGFDDWNSKKTYSDILTALSYLIDLAESEPVYELASVLMDKIFFSIALNSHAGVYGPPQHQASVQTIKSGFLDPLSGITRLMWGMGVFNHHISGTVSLACMQNYELPAIIAEIAALPLDAMWGLEQQSARENPVNTTTYRTPDYLLSSAQDYHPGEQGRNELIWQATLSPQCLVFANHPGNAHENDANTPSFWSGNAVLPRVAQWHETLIALYHLPDDVWMDFTHAYFPTTNFDEYTIQSNTAFARKGEGYIALTAFNGITLVDRGRTAFRELRSVGKQNAWVCRMGRSSVDGDFNAFQKKVFSLQTAINDLAVTCQTMRGETLSLDWTGPCLLDGKPLPLAGFEHFQNPFTTVDLGAENIDIKTDHYLLRLHFGEGERP